MLTMTLVEIPDDVWGSKVEELRLQQAEETLLKLEQLQAEMIEFFGPRISEP